MIWKWSQSLQLLLVSPLFLHSTYAAVFLLWGLHILKSSRLLFLITFLSPGIATSINMHVLFSLSRIIMSGLLLGIVLSVCTCWFHSIVTLPPWFVTTEFGIIIIIIISGKSYSTRYLSFRFRVTNKRFYFKSLYKLGFALAIAVLTLSENAYTGSVRWY